MKFLNDLRQGKDPLGSSSQSKTNFIDYISEQVSLNLANATASNYNFQHYGSNQRIFFEAVAKIIAEVFIDISDLQDDSSFSDLRPEFIYSKLLSLIFEDENIPNISDTVKLKNLCEEIVQSLLSGSTEESISKALESTKDGDLIELRKISQHIISIYSSTIRYTENPTDQTTVKHRHIVYAQSKGLGSTSAPIGKSWGEGLHYHEVIDGVVQPYKGHTHSLELGISSSSLEEQENLRKVLKTTKPAHLKIGEISSVLEENISKPSGTTLNFKKEDGVVSEIIPQNEESFIFSLGSSHQENMRKVRAGTWENVLLCYYNNQKVRISQALVSVLDSVSIGGKRRTVKSIEDVTAPDGVYDVNIVRHNRIGSYTITNGFISLDERIGNNEVLIIEGQAYFSDKRAKNLYYLRASEITLDSAIGVQAGLQEITFLEYSWKTPPLKNRNVTVTVRESGGAFYSELNVPLRRSFKGVPILKESITPLNGFIEIEEYYPYYISVGGVSNKVSLKFKDHVELYDNKIIEIRVPLGEDDLVNFTDLNSEQFVLNASRNTRRSKATVRPKKPATIKSNVKSSPTIGIYPTSPIEPKNTDLFKSEATLQGTFGLNTYGGNDPSNNQILLEKNTKYNSNTHFSLNSFNPISSNVSGVRDYAKKTISVYGGVVSFNSLGFKPDFIVSIQDSDLNEYGFSIRTRGLYIEDIEDGTTVNIVSISSTPYTMQNWYKGAIFSEGQVDFSVPSLNRKGNSPEELMQNPQGRAISSDFPTDEPRLDLYLKQSKEKGIEAEEIFFEDDLTRIEIKGHPFISPIKAVKHTIERVRPSLSLNLTSSLIGIRSILNRREVLESTGLRINFQSKEEIDLLARYFYGVFLEDSVVINDDNQEELLLAYQDDSDLEVEVVNLSDGEDLETTFSISLGDVLPLVEDATLILNGNFIIGEALIDTVGVSDDPLFTVFHLLSSEEVDVADVVGLSDEEVSVDYRFVVGAGDVLEEEILAGLNTDDVEIRFPVVGVQHMETIVVSDEMDETDLVAYRFSPISEEETTVISDDVPTAEFAFSPVVAGEAGNEEIVLVSDEGVSANTIYRIDLEPDAFTNEVVEPTDEYVEIEHSVSLLIALKVDNDLLDNSFDFNITLYKVDPQKGPDPIYKKLYYPSIEATGQFSEVDQKPIFDIRNPSWRDNIGNTLRLSSILNVDQPTDQFVNNEAYHNSATPTNIRQNVVDLYVEGDSDFPVKLGDRLFLEVQSLGYNGVVSHESEYNMKMAVQVKYSNSVDPNEKMKDFPQKSFSSNPDEYVWFELFPTEVTNNEHTFNPHYIQNPVRSYATYSYYFDVVDLGLQNDRDNTNIKNLPIVGERFVNDPLFPIVKKGTLPAYLDRYSPYHNIPSGGVLPLRAYLFLNYEHTEDMYIQIKPIQPTSANSFDYFNNEQSLNAIERDIGGNFPAFVWDHNDADKIALSSSLSPFSYTSAPLYLTLNTNVHYLMSVSDPDKISLHLETYVTDLPAPDEPDYTQLNPPPLVNFNTLTSNTNHFVFFIRNDGNIYIK
jgi:hypothetical protein